MNRYAGLRVTLAGLAALTCSDSGTAPTTNVISAGEKAAVQRALDFSFGNDSLYSSLSEFVLPFIDQATPQAHGPGDTTKLAGFQLEVAAAGLTEGIFGILAWRGYHAAAGVVDSVQLLLGAGLTPPVSDSLSADTTLETPGSGTAWVVAQLPDSSVQTWLSRAGALQVASASYGAGVSTVVSGGFTLTRSRGTMAGDYHLTAKLVPDSSTTVTAGQDFAGGIEAVRLRFVGGP